MRSPQPLVVLAVVLLSRLALAAGSGPALSEPPEPAPAAPTAPPGERGDGQTLVARARQLFLEGQWSAAAAALEQAYAVDPRPVYLFNAAQAYRKGERRREALALYQRFIAAGGDGPLIAEAKAYVVDLQLLLAAEQRLSQVNLHLEEVSHSLESERRQAEQAEERARTMEQALRREQEKPWYRRTWFAAVAATTGAVVLSGAIAGFTILGLSHTDGGSVPQRF